MADIEKQRPHGSSETSKELNKKTTTGTVYYPIRTIVSSRRLMCVGEPPTNLGLHTLHSGNTLDIETQEDEAPDLPHLGIRRTPSKTIIFFRPSDPEHPNNWSLVRALPLRSISRT
jgi:hypothetical protein